MRRKKTNNNIRALSKDTELIQEKRKEIIEAAVEVFDQNGYGATSIKDIAKVMGTVPSNLYRYIQTKDDILHLICLDSFVTFNNMHQVIANLTHKTILENLEQCIWVYISMNNNEALFKRILFFNREIRYFNHEDRQLLLQSQEDVINVFKQIIDEGVKNGEFFAKNPILFANEIVLIPQNWTLRRWFWKNRLTFKEYAEQQIEIIMNSLLDPKNGAGNEDDLKQDINA